MEKLQERLQQLELKRAQLSREFDIATGAALEVQRQIQEKLEAEAEVVDEEAKLLERNQNRVFGRLLQSAHLPPNTKAVVAGLVCCEKSDWEWQWAVVQEGTSMYLAGLSPTFKSHMDANTWMDKKIEELAR